MATPSADPCPQSVLTPSPGLLVVCPGCGKTFAPRRPNHQYCTSTCRVVWFQRKPERARRDRDAQLRALLREGLTMQDLAHVRQRLGEALSLLEPEP
jgi:hypothetical protein